MKKFIALLLVLAMMPLAFACGKDDGVMKIATSDEGFGEVFTAHMKEKHSDVENPEMEYIFFPNLSASLLGLDKGEISLIPISTTTAEYLAAHNDKYKIVDPPYGSEEVKDCNFSMLTLEANTELHSILDGAIKDLKANGTLEDLIAENLTAYITGDPTPKELPTFDGAKTYKIAVTGDLPPMDFVSADGKAAGFNVALLTEIANIAKVNFELVTVDGGARLTALSSETVDAVFWTISSICNICGESVYNTPEGTLITEYYFSDSTSMVALKD